MGTPEEPTLSWTSQVPRSTRATIEYTLSDMYHNLIFSSLLHRTYHMRSGYRGPTGPAPRKPLNWTEQTCQKVGKRATKLKYEDIFKEDAGKLKEISEEIIRVENLLKNPSKQHELLTHEWATQTIWAYALQQQQRLPSQSLSIFKFSIMAGQNDP